MGEEMPSSSASTLASCSQLEEGGSQLAAVTAPLFKISRTSYSPSPALASTNAAQNAPPPPTPPVTEADDRSQRDYELPVRPQMVNPDDYECDDDDNDKDEKVE